MENKNLIFQKLEAFIKKFYTNELLKGSLLFIGLGVLYFIGTLLVEYFLWLSPKGRTFLFWLFVSVEIFLLLRFILFPVFKLFKLQKGIDYTEASKIIGNHFSEVSDKLTNFLQLNDQSNPSELLLASIEQKASSLKPIPFGNAINFKKNLKFVPYAVVPLLILLLFFVSGNSGMITQSFDRMVHFKKQYTPPAPFEFEILNPLLKAEQGQDFLLQVKTTGKIVPENAMINIGEESYYLESVKPGLFQYKFEKPYTDVEFQLSANEIYSNSFELQVVAVPTIASFEMMVHFPSYLGRKAEVIQGTGNAVVPEGSKVTWKVNALTTTEVLWKSNEQSFPFTKNESYFSLSKNIVQNTDYQIFTSNIAVKNHEKLHYQITTLKDQYPTISIEQAPDSLKLKGNMILGQVSDDYGLSKLQVIFYPKDNPKQARRGYIPVKQSSFDQFVYSFPSGLTLQQGVDYDYYFEIFDNDALHNYKSTKSSVFSHRELTENEKQEESLQEQNSNINSLEKSIKNQDKQLSELDKLQKMGKEKTNLDFKDQKKVQDFINRQKQQDEMMKEFSKKLEDNLKDFNAEKKDEFKDELLKRLEKNEKEIEKNEKLLKELEELTNKLQEEELFDKIDKLKQNTKDQTKSLEQLVEMTKRFYVEKKAEQIAEKLDQLSKKEDKLSDSKDNDSKEQNEINKEFDKIQDELNELDKENKELKAPMDIPNDKQEQQSIEEDLKKAADELQKNSPSKAKPKQKSAAQKMQQMSQKMQQSMEMGDMEQMEEDVKMLRQILDNLLAFSFSQEDVMKDFKSSTSRSIGFNKLLKKQQDLKNQFKHVDDSLFAMSLRNPKISEMITKEVGNVQYNIEKSIDNLSDNNIPKGVSHQQYTITSANKLADFLSDAMNQMQMELSMPAQGQGSGKGKPKPGQGQGGMQLPDIIKKQEGLSEKMKQGMQKGQKPGEGQPDKNGNKGSKQGEGGQDGEGNAGEVLEIYKEQQRLREALQKALEKEGMGGMGQNAAKQMQDIEKQLLNKGFKNETLQKMLNLKHELLKLDKAIQQQGEENKRQSQTNKKVFNNQANQIPPALKEYLNSVEILNRQSLPLRPNFNQKVQTYFKNNDKL
ncbi:chromosome segregation ATPase [Flavobacterium enshiense DK69]|uniref:Glutamyl-tRNA synthetase n=1 Tax=Flavobacterium enshiense DK69 TaxID=1107311 RepID=V6SDL3_9FLAO|nr:DUF4175 family protein [Flavobacterium enshiense]ESU24646.1 chromosome segregation ATPase [Flavobacterium enshiense DK69]KGO95486.1 glutamyl-tRNA synthetase [Flavobacterium enshiense DK69]